MSTRIRTGVAVEQGNEDLPDSDNSFFGGRVDDLLLAAEVPLDRARRHSCGGDDVVHRCGVEAVTREAPPGTGEDVLAALGAGGVAEPWHTTYPKRKRSFALLRIAVYLQD